MSEEEENEEETDYINARPTVAEIN